MFKKLPKKNQTYWHSHILGSLFSGSIPHTEARSKQEICKKNAINSPLTTKSSLSKHLSINGEKEVRCWSFSRMNVMSIYNMVVPFPYMCPKSKFDSSMYKCESCSNPWERTNLNRGDLSLKIFGLETSTYLVVLVKTKAFIIWFVSLRNLMMHLII